MLHYLKFMRGTLELLSALALGAGFLWYAIELRASDDNRVALRTFHYSISYLVALFSFLLLDHYLPALWPG